MIFNIIDKRDHPHRWKDITVIIEPTWHDNYTAEAHNGDESPVQDHVDSYKEFDGVSLGKAIEIGQELDYAVTLYIYDRGKGINIVDVIKPLPLRQEEQRDKARHLQGTTWD